MRGSDVVCDALASEGIVHVFGNPGTTELPLMDTLGSRSDLEFVLGLQEATVVGMADGYARASGRPAFACLHANAGLGNAMGALTNAVAHRAPIVVMAGNADRRHAIADPLLSGDLVGLADSAVKWGTEVVRPADVGVVMRRAFRSAAAPPAGPVFVSLPTDVLDGEAPPESLPPVSFIPRGTVAAGVDGLSRLLASTDPERVVIVAGDAAADADALEDLTTVAELLGCAVYGAPFHARRVFPSTHPLWKGTLEASADTIRRALAGFDVVFVVDHQPFLVYGYSAGSPVPEGAALLHLTSEVEQVGRTHSVGFGLVGDVSSTLRSLVDALGDGRSGAVRDRAMDAGRETNAQAKAKIDARVTDRWVQSPTHPMAAAAALLSALPDESIVVDEAVTTGAYLRGMHRTAGRDTYWFCRGGGLGWGMPAGLGISLATGREPVLVVVGDGSAMYSPQALWTAAREDLPVVVAVVDNGEYAILKQNLRRRESSSTVGMDVNRPAIDFSALATSMGVAASRADSPDEIRSVLDRVWGKGPHLIHIPIAPSAALNA